MILLPTPLPGKVTAFAPDCTCSLWVDGVFPQAQLEQSKALELQGVMAAEAGDLATALERFAQAIDLLPERASAYNNRAQARRLQGDVAGEERDGCSFWEQGPWRCWAWGGGVGSSQTLLEPVFAVRDQL